MHKIFVAIPHHVGPSNDKRQYGAELDSANTRRQYLLNTIDSLIQSFHHLYDTQSSVDIEVVTGIDNFVNTKALLKRYQEIPVTINVRGVTSPANQIPFDCNYTIMSNFLTNKETSYNYYCYVEDDIIINDPHFFTKLDHVYKSIEMTHGIDALNSILISPIRYEWNNFRYRVIDPWIGDKYARRYNLFAEVFDETKIRIMLGLKHITFSSPSNPHAACYFLKLHHMLKIASVQDPNKRLDCRDDSFVGPIESAADLPLMKNFVIFKPDPNSRYLEVQHQGTRYS